MYFDGEVDVMNSRKRQERNFEYLTKQKKPRMLLFLRNLCCMYSVRVNDFTPGQSFNNLVLHVCIMNCQVF